MKNKKLGKATIWIAFIFISFLFVMTVWGGLCPLTVMSGSMEPSIKTGSVAIIETNLTDFNEIEKGDIITFDIGGSFVTHRAVDITEDGVYTKGDANNARDPWIVTNDNYYGKELFSIPYIGFLIVFIRQHIIVTVLVIAVVLITAKIFKGRRVQDV